MIDNDRIFDIAQACLDAVAAHFITEGADLPARQYVGNGLPAWDCDQCVVWCESTYGHSGDHGIEDPRSQFRDAGHAMRAGIFCVSIVRCVPVMNDGGTPPTPAAESASARAIYADAVLSLNALIAAEKAGDLPGCGAVVFRQWTNENAQGGYGGGTLRVAISLDGL